MSAITPHTFARDLEFNPTSCQISPETCACCVGPAERWAAVPGFEGSYEVSSAGRVRSLDRTRLFRDGRERRYAGQQLRTTPDPKGYPVVNLSGNNKRQVHTLVACAFRGPRPAGQECRHLNGVSSDNRACNLVWGTSSENKHDLIRHGRHYQARKTACPRNHLLIEPNLVVSTAKLGYRKCKACHRALSRARNGTPFGEEADREYLALSREFRVVDLPFNPVSCGVTPHAAAAVLVYEAVVSERISDSGRLHWYMCDSIACLCEAQQQADSYMPTETDLRDATVAELAALSGIEISTAGAA